MRVVLFEDEPLALRRLRKLIETYDPTIQVVGQADSIQSAVAWLQSGIPYDLIFCDIQLADGPSFEIFRQVDVLQPIVFTTAYDQYALEAFEVNCVDYLLKPINQQKLAHSLNKYHRFSPTTETSLPPNLVNRLVAKFGAKNYKERFLVKVGNRFVFITAAEVAYFYAEGKTVWLVEKSKGQKFVIESSLDQLENELLDPQDFVRINRSFIIHLHALSEIKTYHNGRLKLSFPVSSEKDIIVARERVSHFKAILDA